MIYNIQEYDMNMYNLNEYLIRVCILYDTLMYLFEVGTRYFLKTAEVAGFDYIMKMSEMKIFNQCKME